MRGGYGGGEGCEGVCGGGEGCEGGVEKEKVVRGVWRRRRL